MTAHIGAVFTLFLRLIPRNTRNMLARYLFLALLVFTVSACSSKKKKSAPDKSNTPEVAAPVASLPVVIDFKKLGIDSSKVVKTASGLMIYVTKEGTGAQPRNGEYVTAHYTGTLLNGMKFDSSRDRNQPFTFQIGVGQVIKGWDEGFLNMKVGSKAILIIPAEIGYGAQDMGNIPPNSTLVFDVELLGTSVQKTN
jgi:peptidylprolyl isomerase